MCVCPKKLKLCARLKRSSWHDSDFVKVSFEKSYIDVVSKPDSIEDDYLVILSSGPDHLELTIFGNQIVYDREQNNSQLFP